MVSAVIVAPGNDRALPLEPEFIVARDGAAKQDCDRTDEWLPIEWPKGVEKPTKFWLSTLSKNIASGAQVDITMNRWRSERDYHDLKQEVGLGHCRRVQCQQQRMPRLMAWPHGLALLRKRLQA